MFTWPGKSMSNLLICSVNISSKTVDDLVYLVNGATKFSKLDITKAFHQIEIDEGSRNMTNHDPFGIVPIQEAAHGDIMRVWVY